MGRDRSRSRSRSQDRSRRRSTSRDRKSSRRRSRSRDIQVDRRRDRDKDRRVERSRSRSPDRERGRDRIRDRSPDRSDRRSAEGRQQQAPQTQEAPIDDKQKRRLALLAKFKQSKAAASDEEKAEEAPTRKAAWMPWEDPGALQSVKIPLGGPPPPLRPRADPPPVAHEDDGVDPLDAFMATEVMPEVKAKEEERKKVLDEERIAKAKMLAEGKKIPKLADLEESDEEEVADVEIEIPANKVKLVIGPGGTKIGEIQKKSKARVQVKKTDEELTKAFGTGSAPCAVPPDGDKKKTVTIMIFGGAKETEIAQKMIEEAIANKEQKQAQRQKEYDRKRETKRINREMYYLRHTLDYECLGVPVGSSKADVKKAYRKLAVKWHPDKHQTASEEDRAAAEKKFQEIQKAYDSLMSTDEEATIEALKAH